MLYSIITYLSVHSFMHSLHNHVVINSTSGSDIHNGRTEVVFFTKDTTQRMGQERL